MATTTKWFGTPFKDMLAGTKVWVWDTDVKVMLTTATYVPNQDTHDRKDDVTNEVSGTGYTAGGVAITNPTVTYDSTTDEIRLDCDDPSWASASFTARNAVWYENVGATDADKPLIGYMDFGADQTVSSGTFTIQLDSTGAFKADAT